jgi:N-formylglutamate amidohydrolase
VELVKAYSKPADDRHSLQIEVNKRLYMDEAARTRHAGFTTLQGHLLQLIEATLDYTRSAAARRR